MKRRLTIEASGNHADKVIRAAAEAALMTYGLDATETQCRMYQQIVPGNVSGKTEGGKTIESYH